jgi:hypothetical protein
MTDDPDPSLTTGSDPGGPIQKDPDPDPELLVNCLFA